MKRKATAVWKGGKNGKGQLSTPSNVLNNTPYNFKARFEGGNETSPEELIAAAHGGCFAMKLAIVLETAGFPPDELAVECTVSIEGGVINNSHIVLKAKVPRIGKDQFDQFAKEAKEGCPVSNALKTDITMEASLA